ncbi:MAG: ABC transporter permease [Clostridiales bacterium]|nr:ABC transporter permease [Clostridiales bacterium]
MGKRVLKRFLSAIGTSVFVIIFNFFLFRILPGDLVTVISKARTSEEVKMRLIEASGLDKPLMTQFGIYIKQLLHGDLGTAFYNYDNSGNVLDIIVGRIPNTVILLLTAEIIAIIIGMIVGTICAHKRATPLDTGLLSGSLVLYSMPTFWFAMLLIFIFCVNFRIFPTGGIFTAGTAYHGWMLVKDYLRHMALPSLCMGFAMVGCYAVTMRSTMIGILTEDYIQTARAKGFSTRYILLKHAIPNAMLPMATIIAMNIAFILGGAIQLETLFSWKGLGQLMYLALDKRDFPLLQGCFLVSTLAVIFANFIMDILYGFIDPRVKE